MPPRTRRTQAPGFTVPGMTAEDGARAVQILQARLVSLLDLGLTLKHVHWNVVGPDFIGVHEMLDPQHALVQSMVDETAERIATLGGSPNGLPGAIVATRQWDDYDLGRAGTAEHLGAMDMVYGGVIEDHRAAVDAIEFDPISQDMLIGQCAGLEKFNWFIRAHLQASDGRLATEGARTEQDAAAQAAAAVTPAAAPAPKARRATKK